MRTTENECLEALREAAKRLGESPTKSEYEALGLTPASATIIRVVGGWNEAKEKADLETAPSTGSRVDPKPDEVTLPDGARWEELSADQRWHYRNVEQSRERTLARRRRLRSWANDRKRDNGCRSCGETDPACLDFHHESKASKEMAISEMITYGYSRAKLRDEMQKCVVLCANCHRREHYAKTSGDERGSIRTWLYQRKATAGCSHCEESDPRTLVFHHDAEKRATIARMRSNGCSKREIETELERCTVLCANCHRHLHFEPPDPEA